MKFPLQGRSVAILVDNGFEQIELISPMAALTAAGASVDIVSPTASTVRGWNHMEWGRLFSVTRTLDDVDANTYDALLLPSGIITPDHLRSSLPALEFIRGFFAYGKPVAAICQGPQLLVDADVVRGRILTSFDMVRIDLRRAGALWLDEPVVVDHGLVTSRSPADLPAFNRSMVEAFAAAPPARLAEQWIHSR